MNKRERLIGIAMLIVVLLWVALSLSGPRIPKASRPPKEKPKTVTHVKMPVKETTVLPAQKTAESSGVFDLRRIAERIRLGSESRKVALARDPFGEVEAENVKLEFHDLVFSGILWEEESPLVIINDEVMKKGDAIAGFVIEEIKEDEVILIKDSVIYSLKIPHDDKKEEQ